MNLLMKVNTKKSAANYDNVTLYLQFKYKSELD